MKQSSLYTVVKGGKYQGETIDYIIVNDLLYFIRWFEKTNNTRFLEKAIRQYGTYNLKMTFGKYRDTSMVELFTKDPSYVRFLSKEYPRFFGTIVKIRGEGSEK